MPNENKYSLYIIINHPKLNIKLEVIQGNIEEINKYTKDYEDEQSIINEYKETLETMYHVKLEDKNIQIKIVNKETKTIEENKIVLYKWIIGITKILLDKENFYKGLIEKYPAYEQYLSNEKSDYITDDMYIKIYKYYKDSKYYNKYPEESLLKKYNQQKTTCNEDECQLKFF